jgi:hypothetical protein
MLGLIGNFLRNIKIQWETLNQTYAPTKNQKTNNIKNLKNRNKKAIFAILDGGLKSNNNLLVLSPGDIVGSDTLNKLCEVFKIHKYITILSVV